MKDSFVFYSSYAEAILAIDDSASQMKVMRALWDFAFKDIEPRREDLNTIEYVIFSMAKPNITASIRNYENGKKGGAPMGNQNARKQKQPINNPQTTPPTTNVNDNVNVTVTETEEVKDTVDDTVDVKVNAEVDVKEKENLKNNNNDSFSLIPTLREVQQFCIKQRLQVDPVEFWTYYNVRRWQNVKNWQRAILKWNEKSKTFVNYNSSDAIPSV